MSENENIAYDHDAAAAALQQTISYGQDQRNAHNAVTPALPSTAAGRDFQGHGARLADALQRVHDVGNERIDHVVDTADKAMGQLVSANRFDVALGAELKGRS